MILSGEKKEEYRELKYYWCNRFCKKNWQTFEVEIFEYALDWDKLQFDTITFTNGYGNDKPRFVIAFNGLDVKRGKKEWGAPPYETFAFRLGNIIETKNIKPC